MSIKQHLLEAELGWDGANCVVELVGAEQPFFFAGDH